MKKVVFAALALTLGFSSCSQDDDNKSGTDGYVDVKLGTDSGVLKSIVTPGGATSWDVNDKLNIVDIDATVQTFTYNESTPKSSAKFSGKLKATTGTNVYKAYYAPQNSQTSLESGKILVVKRKNVDITSGSSADHSAQFGTYCPMVAIPFELDLQNQEATLINFHHLACMIEARVSLRDILDQVYLDKNCDKVVFELKALNNAKPFYDEIKIDMSQLNTTDSAEHLDDCITNFGDTSVKTDFMSSTMNLSTSRTISYLVREYSALQSFPIAILALPTDDNFDFTATVTFYEGSNVQLKMQGSSTASKLKPTGLNVLNFDYKKIVP